MRIGFIGLGKMGGPMALNLIKAGHALIDRLARQHERHPAAVAPFVASMTVTSPPGLGRRPPHEPMTLLGKAVEEK